jgi:ribosome biogenesis protein NSA1
MPRFYAGDDLGTIKSISYSHDAETKQWKAETCILSDDALTGKAKAIQKLALHRDQEENALVSPVYFLYN